MSYFERELNVSGRSYKKSNGQAWERSCQACHCEMPVLHSTSTETNQVWWKGRGDYLWYGVGEIKVHGPFGTKREAVLWAAGKLFGTYKIVEIDVPEGDTHNYLSDYELPKGNIGKKNMKGSNK